MGCVVRYYSANNQLRNNMHFFYFNSRIGKYIFFLVAIILVGGSLWVSNNLVQKLEQEERNKMEIWAAATSELASADIDGDIDLILTIIQSNTTIPVIVADDDDAIVQYSNIDINSTDTATFLAHKLERFKENGSTIEIDLGAGLKQTLYYDDSILLKQLFRSFLYEKSGAKQGVGRTIEGDGSPVGYSHIIVDGVDGTAENHRWRGCRYCGRYG